MTTKITRPMSALLPKMMRDWWPTSALFPSLSCWTLVPMRTREARAGLIRRAKLGADRNIQLSSDDENVSLFSC